MVVPTCAMHEATLRILRVLEKSCNGAEIGTRFGIDRLITHLTRGFSYQFDAKRLIVR
jgi:hypothetical protein